MNRFAVALTALVLAITSTSAQEKIDPKLATADKDVLWYSVKNLDLEGKAWSDTKAYFDRLPAKAESAVRAPVWSLSRHSAGMCVRFVTDASAIQARWTLTSPRLAMPHMAATGVSGLDLYVKTEKGWRWLGVGQPKEQMNTATLASGIPAGTREYLLYLPLYNGVSNVEIGVAKDTFLAKGPAYPRDRKPIVFYGTSITQGGCASRTGMVHTAILGRRLGYPVVNLGFSGNGRMEPEVVSLIGEIDASVYVIDCVPNMSAKEVAAKTEPLVRMLRKAKPNTPILLVEDRNYDNGHLLPGPKKRNQESQAALKAAYDRLTKSGVKGLYYLEGANLLGDDNEGTVDSSHPTDLGFLRQADVFEKALRPILKR
ncbi:MAG TPA: SGNH/GDSL hydrolase family protein [Gemmataceae bacterium]|nr:SGNH/GDSL hydrolase family protein [Gemmataceae bacterium]